MNKSPVGALIDAAEAVIKGRVPRAARTRLVALSDIERLRAAVEGVQGEDRSAPGVRITLAHVLNNSYPPPNTGASYPDLNRQYLTAREAGLRTLGNTLVDDAFFRRMAARIAAIAGEDFDSLGEFTQNVLINTQRDAYQVAMKELP